MNAPLSGLTAELLRGYGQILFCGRRRSGLLIFVATWLWPLGGACGLLGALAATITGRMLAARETLRASGLYACNGALAGIALAVFGPRVLDLFPLAAFAGLVAALTLYAMSGPLDALELPPLSLPFVFSTWAVISVIPHPTPIPVDFGGHAMHALHILGLAVFTWSGTAGLLLVLAVLLHARWQAVLLLTALPVAAWAAALATGGSALVPAAALNMALTLVAVSIVFVPGQGVFLGLVGSAAALLFTIGLDPLTSGLRLPLLVAPFNLATLLTLFALRQRPQSVCGVMAPPFFGAWTVSQGPGGPLTHQGEGRHAWDFVVTDEFGLEHRSDGLTLDDYYAWDLPVRATADGVVACVVDAVDDNPPSGLLEQVGLARTESDVWGNHVIIEHAPGVYSEISHLRRGSVTVAVGQTVQRGQMIGRCGNSGRSDAPHIHVQLQTGPYAGAPSVAARFVGCRVLGGPQARLQGSSPAPSDAARTTEIRPAEGEVIEALD